MSAGGTPGSLAGRPGGGGTNHGGFSNAGTGDAGNDGMAGAGGDQGATPPDYLECFVTTPDEVGVLFGTVCTTAWEACYARDIRDFDVCSCISWGFAVQRSAACESEIEDYFSCMSEHPSVDYGCGIQMPIPGSGVCEAEAEALTACG
jgi:hypothetical protein